MSPQFDQGLQEALDAPDPELDADRFVEEVGQAFEQNAEPEASEAQETADPQEPAVPTAEVPEEAEAPQEVDEPSPPTFVDLGGVQIPVDKAEAVANFYSWSQSPEGQPWVQALSEAMEKGIDPRSILAPPTPPGPPRPLTAEPEAPYVPPEAEYFEPESAYKTLNERLDNLTSIIETREAQIRAATQAQNSFLIDSARDEFAANHELTPDEARQLVEHMDRTTVLAGYRQDPTTGQQRDARSTLLAAMDAAYWAHPTLREKEVARMQSEQKDRTKKDRKLAAVGGTSGSVPHRAEPTTPEERDAQAVETIANAMGIKA